MDGFTDGSGMKAKMGNEFNATKGYLGNALTLVTKLPELISKLPGGSLRQSRRLLTMDHDEDKNSDVSTPHWVDREERILATPTDKLVPHVTVAKDGSGDFKTIGEALAKLPDKRQGR